VDHIFLCATLTGNLHVYLHKLQHLNCLSPCCWEIELRVQRLTQRAKRLVISILPTNSICCHSISFSWS